MTAGFHITDGRGAGHKSCVTAAGQIITAPFGYDETVFNTLDATGTAYHYYGPKAGFQFVITGVIAYATKDVNDSTSTVISIFEAVSTASISATKTLMSFGLGKNAVLPLLPLNIIVTEGVYLNATTDDDDILLTVMGYYVPSLK